LVEASIFLSFFQSKKKGKLKLQPKQKVGIIKTNLLFLFWRCQLERTFLKGIIAHLYEANSQIKNNFYSLLLSKSCCWN
jgi:hypothetical protein